MIAKTKIKIILLVILLFLCFLLWSPNAKYPNSELEQVGGSEVIAYDSLEFCIQESGFLSKEESAKWWGEDGFQNYIGYCMTLHVKNIGIPEKKLDLSDFQFVSETFGQGVDLQRFLQMNESDIKEKIHLKQGEEVTLILPFLIVKENFTVQQWEQIKEEEYRLVLALYPVRKEIVL